MNAPIRNVQISQDIKQSLSQISKLPVYVGFSGGVDSALLLYWACEYLGAKNVVAIHVDHGLSEDSDAWSKHCELRCVELGCEFKSQKVKIDNEGQGLEASARKQRYGVFQTIIANESTLLLGHHLDDQIETVFLRLFRGTGAQGIKGMAVRAARGSYEIFRPMLDLPKNTIEEIATDIGLSWIEDDSNTDVHFDRNFLRQSVLPLIETRWPKYRDRVVQTLGFIEDSTSDDSDMDLNSELQHRLSHDKGLKLIQLDKFDNAQLLSLLHLWITHLNHLVPSKSRLQSIIDNVINAKSDAQPSVSLGGGDIRRHGPAIYWVESMGEVGSVPSVDIHQSIYWSGIGRLSFTEEFDGVDRLKNNLPNLNWRLRVGGEVLRPLGRSKQRDLKRLFQEYRHKPWLRDRTPLLYSGDELVAVGDILISAKHAAENSEPGIRLIWDISAKAD